MAHHIYQTEGIVLASSPEGESSRYIRMFTRELGYVGATARSIREGKSKLRYGLQDFSVAKIGLVRGKEVWRIVNAVPVNNYYDSLRGNKGKLNAAARIVSLVRKLVVGEGRHEDLYDALVALFGFLEREELSRDEIVQFQLVAALIILHRLGYGVESGNLLAFANDPALSKGGLKAFALHAAEARAAIRRALSATHL